MNLPNRLSLFRILLIPFILFLLLVGEMIDSHVMAGVYRLLALILVIIATVTDWLDGYIARRYNLMSNLGKLLDPLADKLLVMSLFIAFVELDLFPSWLIIIILCREFLVTGLRSLAAIQGVVLAADKWGKHKTAWQLVTIILSMIFLTARDFAHSANHWLPGSTVDNASIIFLNIMLYAVVILTVYSGWVYLSKNRSLLKE